MFVKEANGLPELKMISPLLTNMEVVKCISVRGGTSVYIVKSTKSNQSYYLKHICIPESQKQVDALMFTGAAATVDDAQNYYKQVAADYQAESFPPARTSAATAATRSSPRKTASALRSTCSPNTARPSPRCWPGRP